MPRADKANPPGTARPDPAFQVTTLWDFPSRNYGSGRQGGDAYAGATPSYVIWNLLQRYTKPGDLVVDPMAGSGTTLDVARDLGRRALGYDVGPVRPDVFRVDARKLPLEDGKADFVFVDFAQVFKPGDIAAGQNLKVFQHYCKLRGQKAGFAQLDKHALFKAAGEYADRREGL